MEESKYWSLSVWHSLRCWVLLQVLSHSWSGRCFSVCSGLKCLHLRCTHTHTYTNAHTQSKWPFGNTSRVIIVNYSVKLRGLLRGKQSKWAIFNSTYASPASPVSRYQVLTSDACNICRRIRSASSRKWLKIYKLCLYPPFLCLLFTFLPIHILLLFVLSLRALLMSQVERWTGSGRWLIEMGEEGKVGGSGGKKVRTEAKREKTGTNRQRWSTKRSSVLIPRAMTHRKLKKKPYKRSLIIILFVTSI